MLIHFNRKISHSVNINFLYFTVNTGIILNSLMINQFLLIDIAKHEQYMRINTLSQVSIFM